MKNRNMELPDTDKLLFYCSASRQNTEIYHANLPFCTVSVCRLADL